MTYEGIEEELVDRLPCLRPAAERYWAAEGRPGNDCGPYIFVEDMFARFVEILLALRTSPVRDQLLADVFSLIDNMLRSDDSRIIDLAAIGMLEGPTPWWFARAKPVMLRSTRRHLDRFHRGWRSWARSPQLPTVGDIIDLYDVRVAVATALGVQGEDLGPLFETE